MYRSCLVLAKCYLADLFMFIFQCSYVIREKKELLRATARADREKKKEILNVIERKGLD